ncbi:MAG: GNAT family N-acetyltransferase, partial [Thermodesulfobacteriota bacterium]
VEKGLQMLREKRVPVYPSPERAVKSYMYMYQYSLNLEQLYQTPEELPNDMAAPRHHLKALISQIARRGREMLTEDESKRFLETYGIPVAETSVARSPTAAASMATRIGFPVALKIRSPDITYKSDCGGVILGLNTPDEVKAAFDQIITSAKRQCPDARVNAVSVQKMVTGIDYELILGCKRDPTFGPAIAFGQGGTGVEIYRDIAVGLPPLNRLLARRLMEQTKVYSLLQGYRNRPPANLGLLEEYLVRFSQLIIDFPQITEIDINPLAAVGDGFIALDARIAVDKDLALGDVEPHSHLVIEPYPTRYQEHFVLKDGRHVDLRPIRPEDELLQKEFFKTFSPETFQLRFFEPIKKFTHDDLTRFTNIDYRREMAIVAELSEKKKRRIIGIGRLFMDPDGESGEIAVVVADPWQDRGLGTKLVDAIIGVSEDKGLKKVWGFIQSDNERMKHICRKMGFNIEMVDSTTVKVTLKL